MRILAIDYGLKRIGLALSDESQILASALPTLMAERETAKTIDKLLAIIGEHEIEEIVIGMPFHLSGKLGLQADEVKHFASELEKRCKIKITLWDERLTSLQAERAMKEGGLSRKKRAGKVDAMAAVLILQSFLDSRRPLW